MPNSPAAFGPKAMLSVARFQVIAVSPIAVRALQGSTGPDGPAFRAAPINRVPRNPIARPRSNASANSCKGAPGYARDARQHGSALWKFSRQNAKLGVNER